MFSMFNDVLDLLKAYENGHYAGIKVEFNKKGYYYDRKHGRNWWEYYCMPIVLGDTKAKLKGVFGNGAAHYRFSREEAHYYIEKYIHLKMPIQKTIAQFALKNFEGYYVIGVHYRGTDKSKESPRVSYDVVLEEINKQIALAGSKYKIFLATDEQPFLDYLRSIFKDKLCYQVDAIRSSDENAVHNNPNVDHYKAGLEAITDCVLLSQTNFLIRTSSNLSIWSTWFNPTLPDVILK